LRYGWARLRPTCMKIFRYTVSDHWQTILRQLTRGVDDLSAPASGAVDSTIVRFNGTLDFPSIYRGPPSPELDAAWARVARDGASSDFSRYPH
jgi:hypothetical protein